MKQFRNQLDLKYEKDKYIDKNCDFLNDCHSIFQRIEKITEFTPKKIIMNPCVKINIKMIS